ncbi:hypothetical protein KKF34_17305 [Myxococcota bacterium]|nr:hypothetical protein [Myxococcota bacterium]MBU1380294.1 hypothetical protein [Myxococcota bacterium]MBU1498639.1 hypothetical protein [Myxococcota bacterium]
MKLTFEDLKNYKLKGDKKNTEFLNTWLPMVYERRHECGIDELVKRIGAVVMSIDHAKAVDYICRLHYMTPYRFKACYVNATHRIYILENTPDTPVYFILEPLSNSFTDELTEMNDLYPLSKKTPNARYVGEIFVTTDRARTADILRSQDIRFHKPGDTPNAFYHNDAFIFSKTSTFTRNRIGYTENNLHDFDNLDIGEKLCLSRETIGRFDAAAAVHTQYGLDRYIGGIDHIATRLLYGDREEAILEFITMTNYYYWGAYNIDDQNSSTNVTRNPNASDDASLEVNSPAKVFTANNTPSFLNSFRNLPMPTETFVLRYGRRLHHIAYEIKDLVHEGNIQAIDYVVATLRENGIEFLAKVFGSCAGKPDLKQIFSKTCPYDVTITEYVQRCMGFDGFFTKENVGDLTQAAGLEVLQKSGIYD